MDMITLALAKSYTDSQRLAYVEDRSITFDGDISGKEILFDGFVKVSDDPLDLNLVQSITMTLTGTMFDGEQTVDAGTHLSVLTKEMWQIIPTDFGQVLVGLEDSDIPILFSVQNDMGLEEGMVGSRGIYALYILDEYPNGIVDITYISNIEIEGVVHGIDPKYLPEGGFGYIGEGDVLLDSTIETEILPDVQATGAMLDRTVVLTVGKTYTVSFDNVKYSCECKKFNEYEYVYLGNLFVSGEADYTHDTGEPFCYVGSAAPDVEPNALFAIHEGPHHIIIKTSNDKVYGIDPKFLPEGGVGYTKGISPVVFNGDKSGLYTVEAFMGEYYANFVRVSDKSFDLNDIICVTAVHDYGTSQFTGPYVIEDVGGFSALIVQHGDYAVPACLSVTETSSFNGYILEPGFYVVDIDSLPGVGRIYVSNVDGVGDPIVHTIDPKYLPNGGVGYTTSEPNVITFDGNSNGKTAFSYNDYSYMVKVAESISSLEDIVEVVVTLLSGEELRIPVTSSDIGSIPPGKWIQKSWENINIGRQPLLMLLNDYYDYEAGFYVWTAGDGFPDDGYVSKVIFKGEIEIHHKISPKYLPEGLGYISEEPEPVPVYDIIWNDPDRSGYDIPVVDPYGLALRRIFDYTIDLNDVVSVSCFSTGNIEIYEKDGADRYYFVTDEHSISIPWNDGMRQIVVVHPESFEWDGDQWPAGTYVYADSERYSLYEIMMYQIHKIDPKFLPFDIPSKSYVEELILGAIGGSY